MSRRCLLSMLVCSCWCIPAAWPAEEAWSAGETDVIFSEIHYHPPEDEEKGEFVELYNSGVRWVNVSGWTFTSGIEFTFPDGSVISPAGFLVVARNAAALKAARKIENVTGDFKGSLSNTGEIIELRNRSGRVIASLRYGDGSGRGSMWPDKPDGHGPSLELLEPHPDWYRAWHWGASRVLGGTPGRANSRPSWSRGRALFTPVSTPGSPSKGQEIHKLRINEVRLDEKGPFVEILNESSAAQTLDGLKLTRDILGEGGVPISGSVAKKKLFVLDGDAVRPLVTGGSHWLFLLKADSREIVDSFPLRKEVPAEGSAGRFPDGAGDIFTFAKATPGASSAKPPPSDLVLNEILYHGPEDKQKKTEEEFIEIYNRGKSPVALKGWKIGHATQLSFPDDAVIPAGGYAVAASEPETLRSRLSPEEGKLVFGPLKGKLSNSGATIALVDPSGNVADHVHYGDRPPWPKGADGQGFSLELLSPDLDNRWPQSWTLGPSGGSPCRKNAHAVKTMAPVITGVRHEPAVPTPEDEVVIHAHVLDTGSVSEVIVVFRDASAGSKLAKKLMSDSGQADDGAAKDGHYAVKLPRFKAGTLIGFSIQARDGSGKVTRLPEGDKEFYFQVAAPTSASSAGPALPLYRILMPRETWEKFMRTSSGQNTLFPCTFIASMRGSGRSGEVFYGASIRYRGKSSRGPPDGRFSYRLLLAKGDLFDGRDRIDLNAESALRQKLGSDLLRLAGVPVSSEVAIHLQTPGVDDSRYVDVEAVNNEFLDRRYGTSAGGIYRARTGGRGRAGAGGRANGRADLSYHGPDSAYYLAAYVQGNKRGKSGIQDLVKALQGLDTKDEALYVQKVEEVIDTAEWAAYFAANHVLMNDETTISNGIPDDYYIVQRPTDGKFILVAWDEDSYFTPPEAFYSHWGEPIFGKSAVPAVRRFLQHPAFAPLYHRAIRELLDGPASRAAISRSLSYLKGAYADEEISSIESFIDSRQVAVRDRYRLWPQAMVQSEGQGSVGGGFGTRIFLGADAGPEVTLSGYADPAIAFKVKAFESPAEYNPVTGRWTLSREASAFSAGSNPFWVEMLGARGDVQALYSIDLEKGPAPRSAPSEIEGKADWQAGGPYLLQGDVVVTPGATLRIGPGVNVLCAPGSTLSVRGSLAVEGTATDPVAFRPADWKKSWAGLRFPRTGAGASGPRHSLAYCRFEGGRANVPQEGESAGPLDSSFALVQGTSVLFDHCLFRGIQGAAIGCEGASVELRGVRVADGKWGIIARGGSFVLDGGEISRLSGDGVRLSGIEKEGAGLKGAIFRDVLGSAIAIEGGKVTLDSILICGSRTAISVTGGAKVRASHLTLAANATGVSLDRVRALRRSQGGGMIPQGGGRSSFELTESVLGVENEHVDAAGGSQPVFAKCVVAPAQGSGESLKGEGILRETPRFTAAHIGDFRLEKGSPGQSAGGGGKDYGFDGDARK